ncbi:MAG: preprotein translocase subunit SecG [Bacteroidales bacterium]|nr:preprotein translocase subunit SecG [Deltaproteobacteria bacterium]MBL7137581.1 preprotein translocase subunit SecG [Bacteroidales bacterium]
MGFYILISVLILITCVLMVLVVLVQNSKGGGLASNFASSNQYMGVRKTADFLEKSTWTLAIVLLILSLFSIFAIPKYQGTSPTQESEIQRQIDENSAPINDFQAPPERNE